jgi:death-on-curing protein
MTHGLSPDEVRPLCLDGLEGDLAQTIIDKHDEVMASSRGYNPQQLQTTLDENFGKVLASIDSVFCTHYGQPPTMQIDDIFDQMASFAMRLAKDHVFLDGNKRTTVLIVSALLHRGGLTLDIEDSADPEKNELYRWIQNVVSGDRSSDELASFLRDHAARIH